MKIATQVEMSYATWNSFTAYGAGDVVVYAGLDYVATVANQNVPPFPVVAAWALLNPPPVPGVSNPLTADLDAATFDVLNGGQINATTIGTENLVIQPGSLATYIDCQTGLLGSAAYGIRTADLHTNTLRSHTAGTVSLPDTLLVGADITMAGGVLSGMASLVGEPVTGVAMSQVSSISGFPGGITLGNTLLGGGGVDIKTAGDVVSAFFSGTPNSLNTTAALARFRDSTEFFVSNNGSDSTGTGSILNPYLTIQKAITQAELISSAAQICIINVASGHFVETLTFNVGYVIVNGVLSTQTAGEVTEITGQINISVAGAADLFNRMVGFQGMNISCGATQTMTDNSTTPHSVFLQDCKVFTNARFYNGISSGGDARTYFTNCEISQDASSNLVSTVYISNGAVEIERVDITTKGNAPCLEIAGLSGLGLNPAQLFRCSLSTFETTNASETVSPIVLISSTNLSAMPFGQCTFAYTNIASKAGSPTSCAIRIASGVNTTLILLNCYFTMTGLTGSGNNVITYNGVGSPALLMNECRSLFIPGSGPTSFPATYSIAAGIGKVNYTDINGPAYGSFCSTVSQPAAAAGAATVLTLNTPTIAFNTLLAAGTRIYAGATGIFTLTYSVQLNNANLAAQTANIFLRKNGVAVGVANSCRTELLGASALSASRLPTSASFITAMNAGEYLEIVMTATDIAVSALAVAATSVLPYTPSVIATLTQLGS